jgi:outer membrane protein OmpA-like peptidoglycan-associated protein
MRLGEFFAAAAAPLLLAACALPAEPRKSCSDRVSVPFPPGATQLNLDAVGQVLLAVATLDACPEARATVTGHADRGEPPALGAARASNVASVLTKNGVGRDRIRIVAVAARETVAKPNNRFVAVEWR